MAFRLHPLLISLALLAALAAPLVAACGDDSGGKSSGAADVDRAYVIGLCKASDDVAKKLGFDASATPDDVGKALEQFFLGLGPALQQLADSMDKLTPPSDIADWHNQSVKQARAAAKAIKDGKFDDPALGFVDGGQELPDPPEPARTRLETLAGTLPECKDANLFEDTSSSDPFSDGPPSPALQSAASGDWTGEYGSLHFKSDGTASFELKACGTSSQSTAPFGVDNSCDGQTYSGKVSEGAFSYTLTDTDGAGTSFQAYVDATGKLHMGIGSIGKLDTGRKGSIDIFAAGALVVDGDSCSKKPFGQNATQPVDCHWETQEGRDVLVYDDDFAENQRLVYDASAGVLVSPEIYVASFSRK